MALLLALAVALFAGHPVGPPGAALVAAQPSIISCKVGGEPRCGSGGRPVVGLTLAQGRACTALHLALGGDAGTVARCRGGADTRGDVKCLLFFLSAV